MILKNTTYNDPYLYIKGQDITFEKKVSRTLMWEMETWSKWKFTQKL